MKIKNSGRRGLRAAATIGALALGLLGVAALGGPASAVDAPGAANMPTGNGSITIHKYEQPLAPTSLPHDGSVIDPSLLTGLNPLTGVVYKVQPVGNIDLATNAGWAVVTGPPPLTPAGVGPSTPYPLGAGTTATTVDGTAAFPDLPIGVYLVTETSAGDNQIPALADPFLVTIPLPSAAKDGTWLTDVNVYPKNPVAGIKKTVDDSGAHGLGNTVNWPIEAKVPNMAQGQTLTSFAVSDTIDAHLAYTPTATVTFATAGGVNVPLDVADYTITPPASAGGTLTVTFNATGIAKLAANQGGTVSVGVATTVTSIGTGTIQNTAVVNVNNSSFTSTPVQTTWGSLQLKKVGGVEAGPALQGAVFSVYTSKADAIAGANPVNVDGHTTFTSGTDGAVSIAGLKSQLNGVGNNLKYYIVETTAPNGYQIATGYDKASGGHEVTVLPGSEANATITVVDPQVPPFALPLTGSTGTALFIGGGIALIALALGSAIVLYRRKAQVLAHGAAQE